MSAANDRVTARRARQRQYHLARVGAATGAVERLEAAFGLLRSDLINTSDPAVAARVAGEVLDQLLDASARIPRRI